MYEHNALGYWSGLTLCLTKVRSSRARCPATALILFFIQKHCGYSLALPQRGGSNMYSQCVLSENIYI